MKNLLKEKLDRRARKHMILTGQIKGKLTDSQKKTPSQLKSERGRKKLLRGTDKKVLDIPVPCDCRGCPKHPCGTDLQHCDEMSNVLRCKQCGQRVQFRIIVGVPWEYCPVCKESRS